FAVERDREITGVAELLAKSLGVRHGKCSRIGSRRLRDSQRASRPVHHAPGLARRHVTPPCLVGNAPGIMSPEPVGAFTGGCTNARASRAQVLFLASRDPSGVVPHRRRRPSHPKCHIPTRTLPMTKLP